MNLGELFAWPQAWPILLAVPLVWLALLARDHGRRRRLVRALGPRASALTAELGGKQRRLRRRLTCGGLGLALLAALQPLWGEGLRKTEQRGVDILVCLDVSRSMLARDQAPSRLESARREIRALSERVRGGRLGLVVFAGEARLAIPLTRDMNTFAELVARADPLSVSRGGTDLGAALEAALAALAGQRGENAAVLLLTDGEDLERRGLEVARKFEERGIALHCVGFGSARGSKIAIASLEGEAFLRDGSGAEVVSAMDPASLRAIAAATGGEFVDAAKLPLPLLELHDKRIEPMARRSFEAVLRRERQNRFQWPLLLAFLLWILELCITDRKIH